jgi:hypothetical protein
MLYTAYELNKNLASLAPCLVPNKKKNDEHKPRARHSQHFPREKSIVVSRLPSSTPLTSGVSVAGHPRSHVCDMQFQCDFKQNKKGSVQNGNTSAQ